MGKWQWVAAAGVGSALAAGLVVSRSTPARALNLFGSEEHKPPAAKAPEVSGAMTLPNFVDLAKRNFPAVVNISTTSNGGEGVGGGEGGGGSGGNRRGPGGPPQGPGNPDDPFHEFWEPFERFFGPGQMPRRPFKQKSLGSGFVIDKQGLILTNNHVIEDADEIVVKLADGSEHKAKMLGRDKKTDIALIRIDKAPTVNPVTLRLGPARSRRMGHGDRQPVRSREYRHRWDRQRQRAPHRRRTVR